MFVKRIVSLGVIFTLLVGSFCFGFAESDYGKGEVDIPENAVIKITSLYFSRKGFTYTVEVDGKVYTSNTSANSGHKNLEIFKRLSKNDQAKVVNGGTASFFSNPVDKKALFGDSYEDYRLYYQKNSVAKKLQEEMKAFKVFLAKKDFKKYVEYFAKDFDAELNGKLLDGNVISNKDQQVLNELIRLRNSYIARGKKMTDEIVLFRAEQRGVALERLTVVTSKYLKKLIDTFLNPTSTLSGWAKEMGSNYYENTSLGQKEGEIKEDIEETLWGVRSQKSTMTILKKLKEFINVREARINDLMNKIDILTEMINTLKQGKPKTETVEEKNFKVFIKDYKEENHDFKEIPGLPPAATYTPGMTPDAIKEVSRLRRERASKAAADNKNAIAEYELKVESIRSSIEDKGKNISDKIKNTFGNFDSKISKIQSKYSSSPLNYNNLSDYISCKTEEHDYIINGLNGLKPDFISYGKAIDNAEKSLINLYTEYASRVSKYHNTYKNNTLFGSELENVKPYSIMFARYGANFYGVPSQLKVSVIGDLQTYKEDQLPVLDNPILRGQNLDDVVSRIEEYEKTSDKWLQNTIEVATEKTNKASNNFSEYKKLLKEQLYAHDAFRNIMKTYVDNMSYSEPSNSVLPMEFFENPVYASAIKAIHDGEESTYYADNTMYNKIKGLHSTYLSDVKLDTSDYLNYYKAFMDYLMDLEMEIAQEKGEFMALIDQAEQYKALDENLMASLRSFPFSQNMAYGSRDFYVSVGNDKIYLENSRQEIDAIYSEGNSGFINEYIPYKDRMYGDVLVHWTFGINKLDTINRTMAVGSYYARAKQLYDKSLSEGTLHQFYLTPVNFETGVLAQNVVNNYFN